MQSVHKDTTQSRQYRISTRKQDFCLSECSLIAHTQVCVHEKNGIATNSDSI